MDWRVELLKKKKKTTTFILSQKLYEMEGNWKKQVGKKIWNQGFSLGLMESEDPLDMQIAVQHVRLLANPCARQASLSFTISRNLLKLLFIELVMPSSHQMEIFLLCHRRDQG